MLVNKDVLKRKGDCFEEGGSKDLEGMLEGLVWGLRDKGEKS